MATVKLTVTRGKPGIKDVAVTAGTSIPGSDAMELNIDFTKLTRGEAIIMLQSLKAKIFASRWPIA